MSETALRLRDELGRLSVAERAELAKFLLESLDDDIDPDYDPEHDEDLTAELLRREQEVLDGTVKLLPAWEMMAELRQKFSQ